MRMLSFRNKTEIKNTVKELTDSEISFWKKQSQRLKDLGIDDKFIAPTYCGDSLAYCGRNEKGEKQKCAYEWGIVNKNMDWIIEYLDEIQLQDLIDKWELIKGNLK